MGKKKRIKEKRAAAAKKTAASPRPSSVGQWTVMSPPGAPDPVLEELPGGGVKATWPRSAFNPKPISETCPACGHQFESFEGVFAGVSAGGSISHLQVQCQNTDCGAMFTPQSHHREVAPDGGQRVFTASSEERVAAMRSLLGKLETDAFSSPEELADAIESEVPGMGRLALWARENKTKAALVMFVVSQVLGHLIEQGVDEIEDLVAPDGQTSQEVQQQHVDDKIDELIKIELQNRELLNDLEMKAKVQADRESVGDRKDDGRNPRDAGSGDHH